MVEMKQGSAAWLQARVGKVTASRMADLTAKLKSGKPGAARESYMLELIAERLTGLAVDHFVSREMQWGTDNEPRARAAYEFVTDHTVDLAGFVPHPRFSMAGASPDGLIGADGLVEFKCPTSKTHATTLATGQVPEEYLPQVFWQMACTGRAWCDFASFDPRFPEGMDLLVVRVPRDDAAIAAIEADVAAFLEELDQREAAIRERFALKLAA
ncbi:lambda exonuclease family protein [uncultured Methylobacterium sp.]|uniref:lambda exonuclease family protein n=1 Tax=uncultured Methylobacterium sp. TaxID=157278 RepID=UPI0035CB6ECC